MSNFYCLPGRAGGSPNVLEADVMKSFSTDPIALASTKGTPEVHGKKEAVN
jgi:hypothetical protein